MLPLDLNHLSMLSVSVFFICPCCLAPGDPISIFLIPGDYISMLGCRIGTELMRAFLLPILTPHLSSHHPQLACTSALSSVTVLGLLSRAMSSVSQGPLRILVGLSFLQAEATLLPSLVVVLKARLLPHKAFVTELFCQACWSGLTVVILTPVFLFGHMHVYFWLSLHISPAIIYLNCFLICPLAKKFLQHSIIAMTIIIILSH